MKIRKAVIPAAGLGTRFLPATKTIPKEMLPIVDKPTILYNVEEIIEADIPELVQHGDAIALLPDQHRFGDLEFEAFGWQARIDQLVLSSSIWKVFLNI